MKRNLTLELDDQAYHLRLGFGAQKRLKARYKQDVLTTVFSGAGDAEIMASVLNEALHWEGSGNPEISGEDFYDLLVDNGYTGQDGFGEVAMQLAVVSGLISQQHSEQTLAKLRADLDAAFDRLGTPAEEEAAETRPTETAKP